MTNQYVASPVWPPARVAHLELLVQSGDFSFAQIARAMKMTKSQVIGKAYRSRIVGPRSDGPREKPEPVVAAQPSFPAPGYCVFPLWKDERPDYRFCCEQVAGEGKPYCSEHAKLAFRVAGSVED